MKILALWALAALLLERGENRVDFHISHANEQDIGLMLHQYDDASGTVYFCVNSTARSSAVTGIDQTMQRL